MKFAKMLLVDVDESKLDGAFWRKLDVLASERIHFPKDGPAARKEIETTDCLLVSFNVKVDAALLGLSPKLKYVGVLGTGYGKVDVGYCKSREIAVTNVPGYSTEGVAEFTIGVILEQCRELAKARRQAEAGNYSDAGFSGVELKGKTFGVIGLGQIGGRIAQIASGFGSEVIYWSREKKQDFESRGIAYAQISVLLAKSDFISINLALNEQTRNFLNADAIAKIKPGAVVANTAPMELLDLGALEARLAKGDLTFILDHSDELSQPDLAKLKSFKNCLLYPPIAYLTKEARLAKQEVFVKNAADFLAGKRTNRVV
jgi:lactate dehydrogenase-like 2-hydroxyacid dehydrogenase